MGAGVVVGVDVGDEVGVDAGARGTGAMRAYTTAASAAMRGAPGMTYRRYARSGRGAKVAGCFSYFVVTGPETEEKPQRKLSMVTRLSQIESASS